MSKKIYLMLLLLLSFNLSWSQGKRSMTVDDLIAWKRITAQSISDNGKWIACKMESWEGDATVYLYDSRGKEVNKFINGKQFNFTKSSDFLVVSQNTPKSVIDSLKLKKTKKDKYPMDKLLVYSLSGRQETIDSVNNYKLAPESNWIAYQRGRKDSSLYIRSLDGKKTYTFENVKSYQFSKENNMLSFISKGKKKNKTNTLFCLSLGSESPYLIKEGKGIFTQITFNKDGDKLAFLYVGDGKEEKNNYSLWLSSNNKEANEIVNRSNKSIPNAWMISPNGTLKFSKDNSRLFFATSPKPFEKDTTILVENRPNVQVWSWNEPVQYTVQEYNKKNDSRKSYQAVYNIKSGNVIQLANEELPNIVLGSEGDSPVALLYTSKPYSVSSMWEGRTKKDYYVVSTEDGTRTLLSKADYTSYHFSPNSKYIYGYAEKDSCWYSWSLKDMKRYRLTDPKSFIAWNEDNDVPDYPNSYGEAGWSDDDKNIYLYDKYDIWKVSPNNDSNPINLTLNGREQGKTYRVIRLDNSKKALERYSGIIDIKSLKLLSVFNEKTKGYAYYRTSLDKATSPKYLMGGDYMLRTVVKAKESDNVIYSLESFDKYPDLYYSNLSFNKSIKLTDGASQQKQFIWGNAELISWTSLDGKVVEGVIYKPSNFDPSKKYPMIVNFYEKNSSTLHNFRMPEANRSTIDYHYYNSNGYVIFNPDVHYRDGYPGESCYDCVMPGISKIISNGYVDEKKIGAQGHSWGGYQVAYLATRTNLFAAIESGAPVVNMFSAYGGIRWGSGMARSFQYEHTQSRLAGTPWDSPMRYFSNSPLFTMDKVNTPILIMHNDKDGHVPWYQGIEYFVAMKRLQKPCWLLNYTGEPHWPTLLPNKRDFQIRMSQFFDHFLKDKPMPQWMSEGVTAVKQPYELGY